MRDFADNVDLETGVVYDSKESRSFLSEFKSKYNIDSIKGNIFVMDK